MTANKPLDRYLTQLHTYAQAVEVSVRQMIEVTAQEGREAEAAELDFTTFIASWTAMLPEVCALADEAGVDLAVFVASWTDLLATIEDRVASNEALRETMQASISNKISNARLISQNFEWLEEVTPALIADKITMIRSQNIMNNSLTELASRGQPATLRLHWMAEWLKDNGYC